MDSDAISRFWHVFKARAPELARIDTANDPVYLSLLEKLQEINSGLYFEFCSNAKPSELNISADGNEALFPLVESIVAAAPAIPGWKVFALKPKIGFPVTTQWEDFTLKIADVVFDPLEQEGSDKLRLRIYVPGLAPRDVHSAHCAVIQAMDHGLGERQFAECIEGEDVAPLPQGESPETYIPLVELDRYIQWRKAKRQGK